MSEHSMSSPRRVNRILAAFLSLSLVTSTAVAASTSTPVAFAQDAENDDTDPGNNSEDEDEDEDKQPEASSRTLRLLQQMKNPIWVEQSTRLASSWPSAAWWASLPH